MPYIDAWDLAFGDIAILEDREIYLDAREAADSLFADRPAWWRLWAARDIYRENGGRLIGELPVDAQENYRRIEDVKRRRND